MLMVSPQYMNKWRTSQWNAAQRLTIQVNSQHPVTRTQRSAGWPRPEHHWKLYQSIQWRPWNPAVLALIIIRPRKKICVFMVRRPTLIFGPDPKIFYDTFRRKLFKYPTFAIQCSFLCLRDRCFDKNELNVTLQVSKCILDAIQHHFTYKK